MAQQAPQNLDQIMARIREQLQKRKGGGAAPPNSSVPANAAPAGDTVAPAPLRLPDLTELQRNVNECHQTHSAVGTINPRRPGIHNQLAQFIKKVMRRSLTWYTRPLHQFHGAATRALSETALALEALEGNIAELGKRLEALRGEWRGELERVRAELGAVRAEAGAVRSEMGSLRGEFSDVHREHELRLRRSERTLRRVAYQTQQAAGTAVSIAPAGQPPIPDMFPSELSPKQEFDYLMFEDKYRGDEADIKGRQAVYLDYFRGRDNVVDLGCGRGEFLELLRENGVTARGMETNLDMYLLCRDKGLEVAHQDIFAFLDSAPDESMGGAFCSQVIEHLNAGQQLRLLGLLQRKLKHGAPAIVETINPECLYALARNFFMDPTHVRPVHPETLRFALQELDFEKVELRFFAPANSGRQLPPLRLPQAEVDLEQFNQALEKLNQLLYGYQDYAAIAWR